MAAAIPPPSFSESNSEAAAKSMLIPGCSLGPGLEPWHACLAYTIPQVCIYACELFMVLHFDPRGICFCSGRQ